MGDPAISSTLARYSQETWSSIREPDLIQKSFFDVEQMLHDSVKRQRSSKHIMLSPGTNGTIHPEYISHLEALMGSVERVGPVGPKPLLARRFNAN